LYFNLFQNEFGLISEQKYLWEYGIILQANDLFCCCRTRESLYLSWKGGICTRYLKIRISKWGRDGFKGDFLTKQKRKKRRIFMGKTVRNGKKLFSLLLTLAMLLGMLPAFQLSAAAIEPTAVTPEGDVYQIQTAAELAWVAQQVNEGTDFSGKTVQLAANIDLGNQEWTPIGDAAHAFAGTFDGAGKAITGLSITDAAGSYHALFGNSTGVLKDFTVSGAVSGASNTAGVAAVGSGTISGVTSNVKLTYAANASCIGGILGDANGNVTISNCHNTGVITDKGASTQQSGKVAGIAGRVETGYTVSIANCSNTGNISGYQYVAGILGGSFGSVTTTGCCNSGTLTAISFGKVYLGGIVGKLQNGTIDSCYNTGSINCVPYDNGHIRAVGGIAGCEEDHTKGTAISNCFNMGVISLNTSKMSGKYIYMAGNISGGNNATDANTMTYEDCFYLEGAFPAQSSEHASYVFWGDVFKSNPLAYDTASVTKVTDAELKGSSVLGALGSQFKAGADGYPALYWESGSSAPQLESYAVASSVIGGTAAVSAASSAQETSTVSFTVSGIESGKQIKSVAVTDASGANIAVANDNGNYSFVMPSRSVTITVTLENSVSGEGESYGLTLPEGLDAIWTVSADSTYLTDGKVKAGATVTIYAEKAAGAATTTLNGIIVSTASGTVETAKVSDGVYTFTMPEEAVSISLDVSYADLSLYQQTGDGDAALAKTYTRAQMLTMAQGNSRTYYSGWSTETKGFIGAADQYVTLAQLLADSGLTFAEGDSLKLTSWDGFAQTYTYEYLLGTDRYYYADILTNGVAATEKTAFAPVLAITGNTTSDASADITALVCDTLNTYRLAFGQSEEELTGAEKIVDSMPKGVVAITVIKAAPAMDTSWYNTTDDTFTITTADQLKGFAAIVNGTANGIAQDSFAGKTVKLGNNIALAEDGLYHANANTDYGTSSYPMNDVTQYVLKAAAPVWTPIGSGTASSNTGATTANAFAGTFDGQGCTVSGVYTGTKDAAAGNTDTVQGLFGVVTGTVQNVTVSGCITGKMVLGGVVASLHGGTVKNCVNEAVVFGDGGTTPNAGIENGSSRTGAIGGIVGNAATGSSVTGCTNKADITCANTNRGGRTGGIIGLIDSSSAEVAISSNANTGVISSYQYAGGIVGFNNSANAPIDKCYNTGAIYGFSSGSTYIGGIVGTCRSDITNCYNMGDYKITNNGKSAHDGGIVSDFSGTKIENCYNTGMCLKAGSSYGAICGTGYGTSASNKLINCYALSTTIGEDIDNGCVTTKTEEEMKAVSFVAALNGEGGTAWQESCGSTPILSWQTANPHTWKDNICEVCGIEKSPYTVSVVRVGEGTVFEGDTITLQVKVSGGEFDGASVSLKYDTSLFTFLPDELDAGVTEADGVISITRMDGGYAAGAVIAVLNFTAKELDAAAAGAFTITSAAADTFAHAAAGDTLLAAVESTSVEVVNKVLVCTTYADYVTGYTLIVAEGNQVYAYDGTAMYATPAYDTEEVEGTAYAYLAKGTVSSEEALAHLTVVSKAAGTVAKGGLDVNNTGKVDFNDALAGMACYKVLYDIDQYMAQYLRADVNGDHIVNAADVNAILAGRA
jgi:hypothetical protein